MPVSQKRRRAGDGHALERYPLIVALAIQWAQAIFDASYCWDIRTRFFRTPGIR
jgi:hypothetical protein